LVLTVLVWVAIFPSGARAQAFIAGVVRDTSGAVLPGVTVEAASPALIEKTRTVVTDGTGQYRVENLRPGPYAVTFTLAGFNTVKREGIELTGTFTAVVNAELRVGALEETITVTGDTPIVDVQSTTRQRVLDQEVLDVAPVNRSPVFMASLIPAVATANQDVGGLRGLGAAGAGSGDVSVHGSSDTRMLTNGVSLHSANGGYQQGAPNLAAFQEVVVDTGGISAEQKEGGVRMNLIPRDGGNTPRGYFLGAYANRSMQGDNFSQELKDSGLGTPDSVKKFWDVNPAYGGPIRRDRIWYHATIRYTGALNYVPIFYNKNAGNPNAWLYEPDVARGPASRDNVWRNGNARITWQATPKNKLALGIDVSRSCECPRTLTAEISPEASLNTHAYLDPKRLISGDWTAPVTNRVLLDAAFVQHSERGRRENVNPYFPQQPAVKLNGVLEQSNNLTYRATRGGDQNTWNGTFFYRASASYVTGAHALKVGFNNYTGIQDQRVSEIDSPLSFRFNNGVPNQLTLQAWPTRSVTDMDADLGLFVQDRWTVGRVSLTVGLRYDYFHDSFPEVTNGPGVYVPARNIVFPKTDGVRWHDLQPRSGLAYDLLGDGRTAVKVSLNKYLASQAASGTFGQSLSPASRIVTSTTRSWNDNFYPVGDPRRGNFVPDCALTLPAANEECGAMANSNFGSTQPGTTYDPDLLRGYGKREYNWEFSAGIQRELVPRVSVDVSYFRRWFGNLLVTDDRAVSSSDYDQFSIVAPLDPRLPGGGGYVISGLRDLKPTSFGRPADNYLTFADNYGKQIRHWNGFDVTINARPRAGVLLAGGTSTGRTSTDNCEILAKLPELSPTGAHMCRVTDAFLTQAKFLATYTIPRIDLQITGTLQSMPGPQILANYNAPNSVVSPSLGRNLAGGANNVTVNLVQPGTMYGERRNQVDLRFGKILRFGPARTTASLDVYNVLNASSVLALNNAFAAWQRPQQILTARFAKIVVQVDF
jgi:hypothetical protein